MRVCRWSGAVLDIGTVLAQKAQRNREPVCLLYTAGAVGNITFSDPPQVADAALRSAADLVLAEEVSIVG